MTPSWLLVLILFIYSSAAGQIAQAFYNQGVEKINNKDFEGAIASFDSAVRVDPIFYDAYYNRATSKLYLKDYKGAIADFDKTITLKPGLQKAFSNRGIAKLKLEDVKGALKDLDTAVLIDPDNASAHVMRGQVRIQDGDTKGGCYDLYRANELGDDRSKKLLDQNCAGVPYVKTQSKEKELLKLEWPEKEGWKIASSQADEDRKIVELLKNDETYDDWTELGTTMEYRSLHGVPVEEAMNIMYDEAKKNCTSSRISVVEKNLKAKYPWIIFKVECVSDNESESQLYQIVDGATTMYINFRAVKMKALPEKLQDKWVAFFKTASIVMQ